MKEIERAAKIVNQYVDQGQLRTDYTETDVNAAYKSFRDLFAPEILAALDDDQILTYVFLTADGTNSSLCYHLEFNPRIKRFFGSISGGSAYKYGLFQRQQDRQWVTGAASNPEILTEDEALSLGKSIRDSLIDGCRVIKESELQSTQDYEELEERLFGILGKFVGYAWVQKYFHMIFPEKFIGIYAAELQNHILYGFGITPSEKSYGRNGQLALIRQASGMIASFFQEACYKLFGSTRSFYRINIANDVGLPVAVQPAEGAVSLGWGDIGDLQNFLKNGQLDKEKVVAALNHRAAASELQNHGRYASELRSYYEASANDVFVVVENNCIVGFLDDLSPYFYDAEAKLQHRRTGVWHPCVCENALLTRSEGTSSTFALIKNVEELLSVYRLYYAETNGARTSDNPTTSEEPLRLKIRYATGIWSKFARNRIVFGAPGTGKSYTLNREKEALLASGGECERVTFHPDYSYASFVGTYKPVPFTDAAGNTSITYAYVPGPFMRTYVKALKNCCTESPLPCLLIVEEINRANTAAVFGDVFQLLDRGENEVSEYPIHASEDAKRYLVSQLGGIPEDFETICLPDNMFIWATMNSADQGVYPMDTAFKRRWDFTYLGIDDGESGIVGKKVVLGRGNCRRIIEWNALRKAINAELLTYRVNEDKLLGPYFISKKIIPDDEMIDSSAFTHIFKNKVIMYLFEDAARQKRTTLFSGCEEESKAQYSKICAEFDTKGVYIFCEAISGLFNDKIPEGDGE